MSFTLHPSGFLSWSPDNSANNLVTGYPCPECKRVAGHFPFCPLWDEKKLKASTSRGKLFDAVAVLWAMNSERSFITFTLPGIANGLYQISTTCPETGDIAIGAKFSKTLEAWKVKEKRRGFPLSYVWVAEAQMKRQKKFGGVGELHYHLIVNRKLKHDNGKWSDRNTFQWLQDNWNKQLGTSAENAIHVDPLPGYMKSVPAYLSKYLGKGVERAIISRRYQATQDLSKFVPIKLSRLPDDLDLIRESTFTTPNGFDVCQRYYNTAQTLEMYGHHFLEQSEWNASRMDKRFSTEAIINRAIDRQRHALGLIIVDTTPTKQRHKRLTLQQKQAQWREQKGLF